MKILMLIIVVFFVLTNIFSQEVYFDDNWKDFDELWKLEQFKEILNRMTRKSGPRQFFGLMGKRGTAKTQITRKRQKFQSFVGLMGKRSSDEQDSI
ncbi:protachykinin isoform X2 [Hypomesus transpacificus]|uniref:protachykinin isoform X2 n=1 Tax=Hypomesus transpacificus TaxID=137520 RepID=UPI001F074D43|nr:protachykinin isoform X2 [Hypomesus transpacificus]